MDEFVTSDWLAIWQSEFAAIAADREVLEWLAQASNFWKQADDAAGPPGPAPAPAAPDPRLDEIDELRGRLAELERIVAARLPPRAAAAAE